VQGVDRALVSSYRLSIVTMSLSAAVWPQFAIHAFREGSVPLFGGEGRVGNRGIR